MNDIHLYCKENNVRRVGKRLVVADHFMTIGGNVDGDILWRSLRQSEIKISLATVYSTLNWLCQAGFVEKKTSIDRKTFFVLKSCS
jgi:Fe2+ or Zn2+ uptake regulation protein